MNKKKIMVLYTTAGLGHKKAAFGIYDALKEEEGIDLEFVDALQYSGRLYRILYKDLYVFVVSRMKWLWKISFILSNNKFVDLCTRRMRHWFDSKALSELLRVIESSRPDAIVSTHFALASMADRIRSISPENPRMYCLITDYGPHSFWLSGSIDHYFVGSEEVKVEMLKRGIKASRVSVTGIATEKVFCEERDSNISKEEYGFEDGRKTVLIMSGGFGVGPMLDILKALTDCKEDLQAVAVCGHNKKIFHELQNISGSLGYPVKVLGFTDKVAELMRFSDLMITKAGGISVTEALNSRLPMVLFDSIPGQENWNEELLVRRGAAFKAESYRQICEMTDRALLSEDVYEALLEGIEELRSADAAEKIAETVISEIKS